MLRPTLALAALSALLAPQQTSPPVPYVDEGACPFECCTYRDWTATAAVAAYDHWRWQSVSPSSPHKVVFNIAKGDVVTALSGVVVTTRPGRLRVTKATTAKSFSVRFPKMPPEDIRFQRDDVLYLLTYRGEGAFTVWFTGRLLEELDTSRLGVLEESPVTQWWVRIRNGKGQIGWTNRAADFSNKDACGGAP